MRENPFFEMLNFMHEELLKGREYVFDKEILKRFGEKGISENYLERYAFLAAPSDLAGAFFKKALHEQGSNGKPPSFQYFIKCEGVAYVTSYIELQEAKKSSRKAMCIATASLVLAALVGIAQIIIGVMSYWK